MYIPRCICGSCHGITGTGVMLRPWDRPIQVSLFVIVEPELSFRGVLELCLCLNAKPIYL